METPSFFPILVDLRARDVLVVGGGEAALRAARSLVPHGARLRAISPSFDAGFAELPVERIERAWRPGDEGRARLVVAASGDPGTDLSVFANCSQHRILCHVVDAPEISDFHPAAQGRAA